jgi:hypothetical protein
LYNWGLVQLGILKKILLGIFIWGLKKKTIGDFKITNIWDGKIHLGMKKIHLGMQKNTIGDLKNKLKTCSVESTSSTVDF